MLKVKKYITYFFNKSQPNSFCGINPKDFKFPARVLGNPPLQSGETRGVSMDLEAMLKAYLKEAGFDTETAIPGKEVLAELGLSKYLYPAPLITLLTGCTRPRNFTSARIVMPQKEFG